MSEIYFITSNENKFQEARLVAERHGFKLLKRELEKLEVQSDDLLKIAKTSALFAYSRLGKPVLVEDAGLFIRSLNGFPGPYSNYVYRTIGCSGILKLLENVSDRAAEFRSAAVLIYEPFILSSQAEVRGYIADRPRGTRGFGFDPIFIPIGDSRTFGEMTVEEKNKYSHRAKAVDDLFTKLKKVLNIV